MTSDKVILETERLRLRPHVLEDLDAVAALWAEPAVVEFIMQVPLKRSESWTRLLRYVGHWAMLPYGYWVVEDRETGAFLGEVGFADWKREVNPSIEGLPELGWIIHPDHHGKGFATEALIAALGWAESNIAADETVAIIDPVHTVSIGLARKLGFGEPETADYKGGKISLFRRPLR